MNKEKEQAIGTLNPTQIENQLNDLEGAVLNGWINPLDAFLAVKKFESLLSNLKKNITDSAIVEARSWAKGYTSSVGKVELRNSATRYSFKHIERWAEAKKELTDIETESKNVLKSGKILFNEDGEQIEAATSSGGGEVVFVTLEK